MADILVVDDDETIVTAFREFLADEGHACRVASNARDALNAVEQARPDVVIMDIRMPGSSGLAALEELRGLAPGIHVIMMTAYGTSQASIEAMRLGAFDYLNKPLDLDELRSVIDRALDAQRASEGATIASADDEGPAAPVQLIGRSEQMQEVYKLIGVLATTDVASLVQGERGSGKHLVAEAIHFNSHRRQRPFATVDCRMLPEPALEIELFGRELRAGGVEPLVTPGRIEAAAGGTVYLAGVENLPPALQARLARVLQDRRYQRTGGLTWLTADVRIIASGEKPLSELVRQGSFSRDLHEALGVIVLSLPPLRERRDDIPDLVAHFIRRFGAELNRDIKGADDRVMKMLVAHSWPGNVAELQVVIKRACILARGDVVTPDDIGASLQDTTLPGRQETEDALRVAVRAALHQRLIEGDIGPRFSPFHDLSDLVEEALVHEALAVTAGNQVKASEILGVNRATLRKKMRSEA